jgi:hypothetical protein
MFDSAKVGIIIGNAKIIKENLDNDKIINTFVR